MSRDRQIGLLANLPRLQAQQQIRDEKYDSTNYQQVYDLFLAAYGDEEIASKARLDSLKQIVRSETEAARQGRTG